MRLKTNAIHASAKRLGKHSQQGVTLPELMVGIAVGLLVVAVAMGALMASRGISGTVSDATGIQQQASYTMRTIGQQLRQAGSLYLNLNPSNVSVQDTAVAAATPVAFEASATASGSGNTFTPATDTLTGTDTTLTVGYRRYAETVFSSTSTTPTLQSLMRNCLGGPADTSTDQRLESIFTFNSSNGTLQCAGNGAAAQPIMQNVADFQVRYLLQDNTALGDTKIQYLTAGDAVNGNWGKVQAVEVCLVLYGDEPLDLPLGSSYTGCGNNVDPSKNKIDMTTLTGSRARRMHIAFRNVFQLRSQGLIGTVL
ncbi:PilW family protein [Comamonas terrae]|uniref:PilW family protein n=1 Tax=Comamonas terrae TaxID=673548 RepID=A0ABW5UKM6_9BURK|nr:PilW family protein [Comamonas terrae]